MFFDSDVAADDEQAEFGGVKVVVDPSSAQLLTGATLDYKDGLQEAGFTINNPNATRTCGCGTASAEPGHAGWRAARSSAAFSSLVS